jgi:branched-chain amino acid aminotransferase
VTSASGAPASSEPAAVGIHPAAATANQRSAIWIDGQRQASVDGPHVSARDRGLTLADGLFETMHARNGHVFRLEPHLARLAAGLNRLAIPAVPALRDWVLAAVDGAGGSDLSVRVTVTRGVGPGGLAPSPGAPPTVIVAVAPMPSFPTAVHDAGLAVHIASGRLNERAMTAGLKTLAYTDSVAAFLEARQAGADEALLLDTEGHCAEAAASNLFVWTGAVLVTPPLTCGVLPGITRATVIELAGQAGIPTDERIVTLDDLRAAAEAFLTSSLRGVAPIARVGTQRLGDGAPGSCTRRLAALYAAAVANETA